MDKYFKGYSLGIEVLKHERQNYANGKKGNTIFIKIFNQTLKKINIEVKDFYKINGENAQFEKDSWLTGFVLNKASINPGAHRTAGGIFFDSVSGDIFGKNSKTGIIVNDKTNRFLYDALFILEENNRWVLLSCDVTEQPKVPEKSDQESKLKNSIERLELIEEKLGVRLDNLSVRIDNNFKGLKILGEIFSNDESLKQDISLISNLYNRHGDLIETSSIVFTKDKFLGYDTFKFFFYKEEIALETNKIRIYTKKR